MKKAIWSGIAAAGAVLALCTPAAAQTTGNVSVTANVAARARLTLSTNAISFADSDPDLVPSITASSGITIAARARTGAGNAVTLTVLALGDLTSGTDVITIDNLGWASTNDLTPSGTSSTATAQTVGSWTGSGDRSGVQTYSLQNSWSYAPGAYTATLAYTLTAP